MFTQTPIHNQARFKSLQYRTVPIHYTKAQQTRAEELAQNVQAIKPGIYQVGNCIIDQWANVCTCKDRRLKPCVHRAALWLAEGVQFDDPDPTKYLKSAGVEEPQIIAIYCKAKLPACYPPAPKGFRVVAVNGDQVDLENVATGTHATTNKRNISHIYPFYE